MQKQVNQEKTPNQKKLVKTKISPFFLFVYLIVSNKSELATSSTTAAVFHTVNQKKEPTHLPNVRRTRAKRILDFVNYWGKWLSKN